MKSRMITNFSGVPIYKVASKNHVGSRVWFESKNLCSVYFIG